MLSSKNNTHIHRTSNTIFTWLINYYRNSYSIKILTKSCRSIPFVSLKFAHICNEFNYELHRGREVMMPARRSSTRRSNYRMFHPKDREPKETNQWSCMSSEHSDQKKERSTFTR
ncbi:unnamed protein product [Amoebophrya sp. A25]|nr:unnamed protein product [Amoebophrya sp. A25]|eukprot:GSA25T00001019001.1